ncbi:MAG: hypothetical protein Q8K68_13770 [Nitrospirota bacterium]|nr:hypothetical protein [Nitrospirota bacterium]
MGFDGITEADLAYTAGIVDGEGNIGIYANRVLKTGRKLYRMRVRVSNTNEWLIFWLKSNFAGTAGLNAVEPGHNWKPAWYWTISDRPALEFLEAILPYLHMKKTHAELAIKFQKARPGRTGRRPTEEQNAIEGAQSILMKSWNVRGLSQSKKE